MIEPLTEGLGRFHDAAFLVYENSHLWHSRLSVETDRLLDTKVNPYWKQATQALFVAIRDGVPVGRIAAIHDPVVCGEHHSREGFFGFFECENQQETARALFSAAARWLSGKGCDFLHGPFQPLPDFNNFGVLIHGFEEAKVSGEAFNKVYYPDLFSGCGLQKENDFFAFESLFQDNRVLHEFLERMEKILSTHAQAKVRSFDILNFERDEELVRDMVTRSFEDQPLYSKLNQETQRFLLHTLARPEDMHWFMIVEENGRPAGVNLLAPNYDDQLSGSRVSSLRSSEFCIIPEFQYSHAAATLWVKSWRKAINSGFEWASIGYVQESHEAMHHMLERFGCRRYKRFRVYSAPIGSLTVGPS